MKDQPNSSIPIELNCYVLVMCITSYMLFSGKCLPRLRLGKYSPLLYTRLSLNKTSTVIG